VTTGTKMLRGAVGLLVVGILFLVVMNWWGDFKTAKSAIPSREATSTVSSPATGTSKAVKSASSTVVVLIDGLNFRVNPAADAKAIRGLSKGDKLTFVAKKDNWYQVKDAKNAVGWVTADSQYTRLEKP